jgi:hypothetical protein
MALKSRRKIGRTASTKKKTTASIKTKTAPRKPAKPPAVARRESGPDPLDDFIAAAAQSLGLKVEKAWLPAVRTNLQLTLAQAAVAGEFALPDDTEPAPVFWA